MTSPFQSLAGLTAHRNRELLDLALAKALMDVVNPRRLVFAALVEQGGRCHWLERARFEQGEQPCLVDPMWADFDSLPPDQAFPDRLACVRSLQVQNARPLGQGHGFVATFPIQGDGDGDAGSVLEVHSAQPLEPRMLELVTCMQGVYRNMKSLLDYSERDSLTGLLNRKSFDDAFFKALSPLHTDKVALGVRVDPLIDRRLSVPGEGYWLGMLDIDHFKLVNDRFGHLIGDEVLLLVARLLRHSFRFHDRLYRFGGEEFVVLMRCAGLGQAQAVFDRYRQAMESCVFPQVGTITISIGITQLRPTDNPTQALDRADQAVYAAKSAGRNRVIDHAELVRQGQASAEVKAGDVELF